MGSLRAASGGPGAAATAVSRYFPPRLARRRRVMHAMKRAFKVFLQAVEGDVECRLTGDQHVIVSRPCPSVGDGCHSRLQPAPDPVSDDGVSHGLGDGEAEAGRTARLGLVCARFRFQNERWAGAAVATPDAQKFRSLLEGGQLQFPTRANESPGQADRRLRPLARRRAKTFTPPAVSMRLRKPWRRLRTSLLG